MGLLNLVKRVRDYRSVWNENLEAIIADSEDLDKFNFRFKNIERPALGSSGYGAVLFSELFNEGVDDTAALVNSAIIYLCGVVDDEIDNAQFGKDDAITHLESFEDFLRTGKGFKSLNPFRDFITKHFPEDHWDNLLEKLTEHKNAVVSEVCSGTYDDLKASRVQIGTTYGEFVAEIISSFSREPLSPREIDVLKLYSAGCTLLDSVADHYQDKLAGRPTHISLALDDKRRSFFRVILKEISEVNKYFAEGRKLVNHQKRKHYDRIVTLTKMFYGLTSFKKALHYLLDPMVYTEARVGKGGHPFKIYKFRSMKRGSYSGEENLVHNGLRDPVDYSKVTSIGKLMRRYWLDEIPQLINVLRGQMSLIGLRALHYDLFSKLPEDVREGRMLYRPGVADSAPPLMIYHELDRNTAEREYLSQRANSAFANIKCLGLLLKGVISGKLKGI